MRKPCTDCPHGLKYHIRPEDGSHGAGGTRCILGSTRSYPRTLGYKEQIERCVDYAEWLAYQRLLRRKAKKMIMKTVWQLFKEFHNSHTEGQIYTRQELFDYLKKNGVTINRGTNTTVDCYRNMCCGVGLLKVRFRGGERVLGEYVFSNRIPDSWSGRSLRLNYDIAMQDPTNRVYRQLVSKELKLMKKDICRLKK